jgi:hypothetical protein
MQIMHAPRPRTQLLEVTVTEIALRNMLHREYHGDSRDEQYHNGPVHQFLFGSGGTDTALQIFDCPDTRDKSVTIGIDRIDHIPLYRKQRNPKIHSGQISYNRTMDGGVSAGWNIRLVLSKMQFESFLKLFLMGSISRLSISVAFNGIHSRFQMPENAFVETDQSGESDSLLIMPSTDWPDRTQVDCGLSRFVFDTHPVFLTNRA